MSEGTGIRIEEVQGSAIGAHVDLIAAFRMRWFREYPYFYAGTVAYERSYLDGLARDDRALLAVARAGETVVGVATSLPLLSEADILKDVAPKFAEHGYDPADFYYYGEIMVDRAWRGRGIARGLYDARARFAAAHGFPGLCFTAIRADEHDPRRPADYFDPKPMWRRMGFTEVPDLTVWYSWPTIQADGSVREETHPLDFWIKHEPH